MANTKPQPIAPASVTSKKPAANARPKVKPKAKPKAKPAAKTAIKPAVKATTKLPKPKKDKLVRDSFTIPKSEYLVIDALKLRAAKLGAVAKKSELLRAGVKALAAMSDAAFASMLKSVPTIKTGRPSKT